MLKKQMNFVILIILNARFSLLKLIGGGSGGFYYIPLEVQKHFFDKMGRENYIKRPKQGTNPRGVGITNEALKTLIEDRRTRSITINWRKTEIKFNAYKRWVDLWKEE